MKNSDLSNITLPLVILNGPELHATDSITLFFDREDARRALSVAIDKKLPIAVSGLSRQGRHEVKSLDDLGTYCVLAEIQSAQQLGNGTRAEVKVLSRSLPIRLVPSKNCLTVEVTLIAEKGKTSGETVPGSDLNELSEWAEKNLEGGANWRPGATEEDLAEFELRIGKPLPEDFRNFYRTYDGQKDSEQTAGLIHGFPILSLNEIETLWSNLRERNPELGKGECMSGKKIKPYHANPAWIPFTADDAGNHIGIDLDPDSEGMVGQVINFGNDEIKKYVLARSMDTFFENLLHELKEDIQD